MGIHFRSLNLLVLVFIFFCSSLVYGFDFSDVRRSFQQDITKIYGNYQTARVAIVYNNQNRDQLKYKVNLVDFKKELSHELNSSFRVIDPIITQEILNTNQINFEQLSSDGFILKSFCDRADCTQVLMVDLKPQGENVQADFKLYTPENDIISQVIMDIPVENKEPIVQQPIQEVDEEPSILSSIEPSSFNDEHNESWLFFSPTAYINPKDNYLDSLMWVNDLAEVDIRLIRLRYDYSALGKLQLGFEVNAIQERKNARIEEPNTESESGLHSGYASVRYQVIGEEDIPVAFLLGVKGRFFWNKYNTDFVSDDENVDEENDKLNKATVMAAISGKAKSIGLLYNFYIDNQTVGLGARYLITSNIKIYVDSIFYYYENAQVPNDANIGFQAFNSSGVITTLSYQKETEQVQFGLALNW